jgi:hypothetical protein
MGRGWHIAALIIACAATGACQPYSELAEGSDCKLDEAKLRTCMQKYNGREYELFSNCLRYSKPERIAGTWSRDFEWNEFFEGREVPRSGVQFQRPSISLLPRSTGGLPRDSNGVRLATIAYVEFIGRRPLCDITPGYRTLLIDSMISERTIDAQPSVWYQSPAK